MDCPDQELLQRLVDGEVVPTEQELLEEHLRACVACRARAEAAAAGPGPAGPTGEDDLDVSSLLVGLRAAPSSLSPVSLPSGILADLLRSQPASFVSPDARTNLHGKRPSNGPAPAPRPVSEVEEWPTIPGYDIQRFLGRGGMGRVYLARQERLNRLVAVKVIRSTGDDASEEWQRIRNEADALSRLKHPNIVQIFEVGTHENQPYIVLELVEGGNLGSILDGTPWSAAVAAGLVEILARAVHHAHEQKIIHRDLKPGNILLSVECRVPSAEGDQGEVTLLTLYSALGTLRPKIADFGLAKLTDVQNDLTASGLVVGTPAYMAPEQARGRRDEIGPQADVYGLGAILYELLTGRPPFRGETPNETLWQVIYDEPVPPSKRHPKVPRDLETICLKCLEKAPERRYATAEALADDLGRIVAGRAITAKPKSLLHRASKWTGRHKGIALMLAALLPGAIGAGIGFGWRALASRQADPPPVVGEPLAGRVAELEREQDKLRWQLYADHLARVQDDWQRGKDIEAQTLLEECPKEYRHWEYTYLERLVRNQPSPTSVQMGPLTLTLADGRGAVVIPVEPRLPAYCCLNADGSQALVSSGPEALRLVDAASGKVIWKSAERWKDVERIALSPDGAWFVVAATTGLELRETNTGRLLDTFAADEAPLHAVAVSPDGRRAITVGGKSVVKVWELPTGKVMVRLEDKDVAPDAACFTADGRQFLTTDLFFMPPRWWAIKPLLRDADTGKVVRMLGKEEPSWHGVNVAASADGRFLAASGVSQIFVWDAVSGERRATLQLPGGFGLVECVTFSPDGDRIVSGASDGTVKVWRTQTGQELLTLRRHQGPVSSVSFSGDGRKLITGSTDGAVRIWDGRPLPANPERK